MKDSDKKILLVILAIGILVAAWFLVISPTREDIKSLSAEVAQLDARLQDLIAKEAMKDTLLAETDEANERFKDELKKYPADLNQETTVMFLKGVEESNEFVNNTATLPRETQYYVLGNGTATDDVTTDSTASAGDAQYICSSIPYEITYSGTYDGLKDYMQYIADYKYRMNISRINIAYDEDEDTATGSLTLNGYAISGPDREPDKVEITDVAEGKNVIFAHEGTGRRTTASSKYAENDGEAIVTNHNIVMLLNNADNDSADGIILAADQTDEDTYVSSADNSAVNATITITSEDGKNYVEYAIGSDSYKAEVKTEDVTIYVNSSARVGNDDKNGVNVSIDNQTELPVVFKVKDDDASNPRFKVTKKTGSVTIF